jgi:hypothetical protein
VLVGESWYGDGGVRLNTPLKPALKLNADRLVVIGLNSVAGPPLEYDDRRPDVFDGAAAVAQSLLADQLAHDVDTLTTINDDVKESRQPITHRLVRYIFVAPTDRLAIRRLATDVSNQHYAGARGLHHKRELALLGRLLDAGRNPVRGDLLSYLFFAPEFIEPLIELGRRDARSWLDRQGRAGPSARSTPGIALGAIWEIAEWRMDAAGWTNLSEGNDDTVGDLIADTSGSLVGAALLLLWTFKAPGAVRRIPGENRHKAVDD